jgi:hypothetical protein
MSQRLFVVKEEMPYLVSLLPKVPVLDVIFDLGLPEE